MTNRSAFRDIAQRIVNARESLVANLAELGEITPDDAAFAADAFVAARVCKLDPIGGTYRFTHGAFLETDVIARAVEVGRGLPRK